MKTYGLGFFCLLCFGVLPTRVTQAQAGNGPHWDFHLGVGTGTLDGPSYDVDGKLDFNIGIDRVYAKHMWSLDFYVMSDDFVHQGTSRIENEIDYRALHLGYRRAHHFWLFGGSLGFSSTDETVRRNYTGSSVSQKGTNDTGEIGAMVGVQLHRHWSVNLHHRAGFSGGGNQNELNPKALKMTRLQVQYRSRSSPAKAIF